MFFMAISMTSLEKCAFRSLDYFLLRFFVVAVYIELYE